MLPRDIVPQLATEELEIVASVLRIRSDDIDQTLSSVATAGGVLRVDIVSSSGQKCPFALRFGRGDDLGAFGMSLGLGAGLFVWETPEGPDDRQGFAEMVWEFLTSTLRCKKRTTPKGDVRADYWLGNSIIDGKPVHLRCGANLWPWVRYPVEIVEYEPWLPDEAPPGGISAPWPPEAMG